MEAFYVSAGPDHIKRERNKARELRKTRWWQHQLAERICYYCEMDCKIEDLTMDHKVPLARGGVSSKNNIVACCKACNTEKKAKTSAELALTSVSDKDLSIK